MFRRLFLLALLLLSPHAQAWAQAASVERGLPLFQHYGASDYKATPQNWAVVQDTRGLIYVGNVYDGVLEYDGASWRRIPMPNNSTVRALAVADDGRIYVGAQGELGYLSPDETGTMRYVSLLQGIPEAERDFTDVWRVFPTPHGVYFLTTTRLFRFRNDRLHRSWTPTTSFHLGFLLGDRFVLRENDRGLFELRGDEFHLLPGGERFVKERIYGVLPWTPGPGGRPRWLFAVRGESFLLYDGIRFEPWRTEVDEYIGKSLVYGARRLSDGGVAVATLQGGLIILHPDGRERLRLTKAQGLADDAVFDLATDDQGGLWLALGTGLMRLDVQAPLSRFDERNGLGGLLVAVGRDDSGRLNAGTTHGLFRLEAGGPTSVFKPEPQVRGITWRILEVGGATLIGHLGGVHEVRGNRVREILGDGQTTLSLSRSTSDPDRVFVTGPIGLTALKRRDGEWINEGVIAEIPEGAYTLMEDEQQRLWVGTNSERVMRLHLRADPAGGPPKITRTERFGLADGVPRGTVNVIPLQGRPVFSTARGVYLFDETTHRFVPDPRFQNLFPRGPRRVGSVLADPFGRFWMDTQDDVQGLKESGAAVPQADGSYRWEARALGPIAGRLATPFLVDPDGVVWLGSDNGLYRFDPRAHIDLDRRFPTHVRRVSGHDGRVVHGGAGRAGLPELPYSENSLLFEYAAPSLSTPRSTRYQVQLEGLENDWSAWSDVTQRNYTNLPEGDYRFRVRAINVYGTLSDEGVYAFRILPPWYRTWWAYLAYALGAAGLLWGMLRWRSGTLERRNRELAALVEQRTAELSHANRALMEQSVTDPLTGLRNRRYVLDHIERDIALVDRLHAKPPVEAGPPGANADLVFVLVDVDHFKQINDVYGHAAGDAVLQQLGDILRSVCRESDTPVRWGGEEFLIIARLAEAPSAAVVAERIRAAVQAHEFDLGNGQTLQRTCSVGHACYPFFADDPHRLGWEQVVDLADQCLYLAKRQGRNRWVGVEAAATAPPADLETHLREGIEAMQAAGIVRMHSSGD